MHKLNLNDMEKLKITTEIRGKLNADFPTEAYSKHPTKTFLTTLKAMYIVERLNDVFGLGRWNVEHKIALATDDYVLMSGKLIILDYDCEIPEQYGGHKTKGTNTEIADGYKSAITDLLSKSASYLEIGIDMFKGKININQSNSGNQTANPDKPKDPPEYEEDPKQIELTEEVIKKWNKKFYGNKIYIDNIKYTLTEDQITELKTKS